MKTVNFIDAVNSGKRFRPVDWCHYFSCKVDLRNWMADQKLNTPDDFDELINAQFELEEKKIEITESEFDAAWAIANTESFANRSSIPHTIKKELGF